MADTLLEIRDLVRRYGGTTALDGVSLQLERNETVGLVGKNGAGKTTLLSVMAGLMPPNAGTVALPAGAGPGGTFRIGFQAQENRFRPGIGVKQQLAHLARLQGLAGGEADTEPERLAAELGMQEYVNRPMEAMSSGMRKRANVLQAFLGTPDLILLDEPTAGLDPGAAATVRDMIRSRAGHTTFLISSHNLYELQDICRRVLILDRGRITDSIDLAGGVERNTVIRMTLDREAGEPLVAALSELEGIIDIKTDTYEKHKLVLQVTGEDIDNLQVKIQNRIHDQNYSLLQLSRGKSLADEVAGRS